MPSPPDRADEHRLCHPAPEALGELETEMIQLGHEAELWSEPIDAMDAQEVGKASAQLRAALAELELQLAAVDDEGKAELQAEIRMTEEALLLMEVTRLAIGQLVPAL